MKDFTINATPVAHDFCINSDTSELSDIGSFSEFTSEKIFEEKDKGLLA